jgi:hypothetical protein
MASDTVTVTLSREDAEHILETASLESVAVYARMHAALRAALDAPAPDPVADCESLRAQAAQREATLRAVVNGPLRAATAAPVIRAAGDEEADRAHEAKRESERKELVALADLAAARAEAEALRRGLRGLAVLVPEPLAQVIVVLATKGDKDAVTALRTAIEARAVERAREGEQ